MRSILLVLCVLLSLSSCSYFKKDKKEAASPKAERLAVLPGKKEIRADSSLNAVRVVIPQPMQNSRWYKSEGKHSLTPEHIALSKNLLKARAFGKGADPREKTDRLKAAPVIAGGTIYTLDARGVVRAYALDTNKLLWSYRMDVPKHYRLNLTAGMVYENGALFVTSGINKVIALNAVSGDELWSRKIQSVARGAPAARDGMVFVNTADNRLYALSAANGSILWTHSGLVEVVSSFGAGAPVIAGDVVLVPYSSGVIYALRRTDGKEVWADDLSSAGSSLVNRLSDIDASPVVSGNRVFASSRDGILAAYEVYSGARIWEQKINAKSAPWVAGEFLYLVTTENKLVAVHILSGGIKWIQALPRFIKPSKKKGPIRWSSPVMAGGHLLLVGSHGQMVAIAPETGKEARSYRIPESVYLPPVIAHNRVFLYSNKAKLYTLNGQ